MKKLDAAPGRWIHPGVDSRTIADQRQSARDAFLARRYGTHDAIENAYQASQERKANAWKDDTQHTTGDTQVQRDAAYQEFLAKRHGTTDSIENAYEAAQERNHSAAMGGRVVPDGEHVVASMAIMDSESASEVERGARALSAVHDAQAQRQAARQEWIDQRQSRAVLDAAYQAAQERKRNAWKEGK